MLWGVSKLNCKMMLSRHQESSKDQEQGKMGAKPLQKSVSGPETNLLYYRPTGKLNNLSLKFYTRQSSVLTFWLQFNTWQ